MNNDIAGVLDRVDGGLDNSLGRLFSLLRIESISTDPAYAQACREAARWLDDDLAAIGFEARGIAVRLRSPDGKEGVSAFAGKRPPRFEGG